MQKAKRQQGSSFSREQNASICEEQQNLLIHTLLYTQLFCKIPMNGGLWKTEGQSLSKDKITQIFWKAKVIITFKGIAEIYLKKL